MLKNVRKSRILLSLTIGILMMVLFGNVYSLATDTNTSNTTPMTITASTADNTNASATNTNNTNTANVSNTGNTANVAAPITNTNTNRNTNTNTNTNNTNNNVSTYNNTVKNATNLPRTGSNNSKAILMIVVFAISAVYAYKKVSDYNM